MKKIIALCFCMLTAHAFDNEVLQGVSFFSPRSQSTDAARNIVGWHPFTHRPDADSSNAVISITPEFTKSFRPNRIAYALYGTDTLYVSGSQVTNRGENDILADYFGLSPDFESTVCLSPSIINFICTFGAYVGFDGWVPGLYLEAYAPAVWTKWNFKMSETVTTGTGVPFPPLYMDNGAVTAPIDKFSQAFTGNVTFGDMQDPYRYGKICGAQSLGGLSDVQVILGYDFIHSYNGYAGINARLGAPTGSRPNSEYFFEPIVGNGKHWEFGVGFDGRALIWEKDGDHELSIYAELNFTHLFAATQRRSFDLCQDSYGFGSRFILLKEFDDDGNYTRKLLPAINVTTLCCDVSVDLQFELLFMFGYVHQGYTFDIGYNGWLRSKEKISLNECIPNRTYALKGIQNVATFTDEPSNATQSTALLHGDLYINQSLVADPNPPVFIRTEDLNLGSAASPRLLTHKLFTHFSYAWIESENDTIIPYLGLGLSIEFEGINGANTEKPNHNTLSQCAFWIKGGVNFG